MVGVDLRQQLSNYIESAHDQVCSLPISFLFWLKNENLGFDYIFPESLRSFVELRMLICSNESVEGIYIVGFCLNLLIDIFFNYFCKSLILLHSFSICLVASSKTQKRVRQRSSYSDQSPTIIWMSLNDFSWSRMK